MAVPVQPSAAPRPAPHNPRLLHAFALGILAIGDALILQYLNNVDFDYDQVQVYTDTAKQILAYVKARDPNVIR